MRKLVCCLSVFCLVGWLSAHAQSTGGVTIPVVDRPPELADFAGMTPSPAMRESMAVVTDFVQRLPDSDDATSERTDVYLGYDERNLYAVFLAFDSEPGLIRANLSPRENIENDDTVGLLIDTFNDQRTAYAFRSTPLGVQWDARWNEVARTPAFDAAYQAVWYTDGEVTDSGYMVLMTIPIRTLRFAEIEDQTWRVMLERKIPRRSEESYWPEFSIAIEGRLNQAAPMVGVRNVSPGRNIQIVPFIFARDFDVLDPDSTGGPAFNVDTEDDIGLDAKFVFQDSMVLDLTLNPDFSQVESDEPQVTVNERFEVPFPELRPFFIENADYFATESQLVFTRRIIDPEAGARFTGRIGDWGIGTMLMNDEAPGLRLDRSDPLFSEAADIAVFRAFRDISEQSRVGMLYTDRQFGNDSNTVLSIDGRFKLNDNWTTQLQLIDTEKVTQDGRQLDGTQRNIRFDRSGRHVGVHSHLIDTSEDFIADLGFQNRNYFPDTDGQHHRVALTFYPESGGLNSWGPTMFFSHLDDQSGLRIFKNWMLSHVWRWDGSTQLSVQYQDVNERLRPKDFAALTGNRDYDYDTITASFETEMFSQLGFNVEFTTGETINLVPPAGLEPELADFDQGEIGLFWRPIDRLRIDGTYLFRELTDAVSGTGKIFDNKITRLKFNYQFTKELSLRLIAQHNNTDPGVLTRLDLDENLNWDLLARYVLNPWSSLYVGYNRNSSNFDLIDTEFGTELVTTTDLRRDGEQFFVKFSYLFQP
ncbi:MAG TPA: DUF5916 domain-containing protein [Gammaproteobacteria bacterium]